MKQRLLQVARERFLNKGGQGSENIKYKFHFTSKYVKHLHQPVISMGVGSCTFSSHLTWTGSGGRSSQPPKARKSGGGAPSAWRFWGIPKWSIYRHVL